MRPGVPDPPEWDAPVVGEAGAEEELPSVAAPWWLLQTRRARQVAVVVLVVAAAARLAGIVATHQTGGHGGLAVAPSASAPAVAIAGNLTVVGNRSLLRIISSLPAQCANEVPCTLAAAVPPGTTEAISQYLAGADERGTYTVTQTDTKRLLYRAVNAISGNLELLVIVRSSDAAVSPATETMDPSPGAAIRYARRQVGGFDVQVQYTGPPGSTPPVELAVRLSQDPRLLALG